jgi:uncharacterized protein (TIGR00251 family)
VNGAPAWIESVDGGVRLRARIVPRSSAEKLQADADRLRIRVTAAPVDGDANKAVIKLLARQLRVARSKIEIVRGQTGRDKTIAVAGIDVEGVQSALLD